MTTTLKQHPSDTHALLGAWHLLSFYVESSDGEKRFPFGESPQGIIIYTDAGYMSAQLMKNDRPLFESGDQLNGTINEIEESFKSCISYFGKYEIDTDGGFVVHHVEKSLYPNWEGAPQKRFFHLEGDRLYISTPPLTWGGVEKVGVLVWERTR